MTKVCGKNEAGHTIECDPDSPCQFPDGTYGPIKNATYGDKCHIGFGQYLTIMEIKTWRVFTDVLAVNASDALSKARYYGSPSDNWNAEELP